MEEADPHQYLRQATCIHAASVVNHAISTMAMQLNDDYADEPPIVICVMGGGVYFTGQLLAKLDFLLTFDYVQASRYQGTDGKQLIWSVKPKKNIQHKRVLLLDDILDEGVTLLEIVRECQLLGAKEIKTAVLVDKVLNHAKPIKADYVGLSVPNKYVFGCGMDVYGYWRNLPAIYAL